MRSGEVDHSTLSWVKTELDETLKQAGQALEAYTEDPGDTTQMRFCATYLHQVHGILQMLELYGAAMLAEEMEQVAHSLLEEKIARKQEAFEILMRAILQISDYLEKIQGGYRDIPILILPLMNDLRAVRGDNLLTENSFFTPDIDMSHVGAIERQSSQVDDIRAVAKKLRHAFQVGLLGVIRENEVAKNLANLAVVLEKMEQIASSDQDALLWWVGGGLIEGLQQGGIETSTSVKMLLGQIDRQLKRVVETGEEHELPQELIKNILYYVGRAPAKGDRVSAVQAKFDLKALLPDQSEIDAAREGISGPTNEMLSSVATAIKEDLTIVKDGLDLYVRGGGKDATKLEDMLETLKKVGDTLGMLGLGAPRKVVKEQLELIKSIQSGRVEPSEQSMMDVAGALIYVESSLDNLVSQPAGTAEHSAAMAKASNADGEVDLLEFEFDQVFGTAIKESIADIEKIKEAIVKFIDSKDHDALSEIPQWISSLRGALNVLELRRPSDLVTLLGQYIEQDILYKRESPDAANLDILADGITSIEYYLEGFLEKTGSRESVLGIAEDSVRQLGYPYQAAAESPTATAESVPSHAQNESAENRELDLTASADVDFGGLADELDEFDSGPAIEAASEEEPSFEEALELDEPIVAPEPEAVAEEAVVEDVVEPVSDEPVAPKPLVAVKDSPLADLAVLVADYDDEILEIFLEEADELQETLVAELPKWLSNPENENALGNIRRMFHTFKGSGRLAGAQYLGGTAWVIETLLNRVLDKTIEVDERVRKVLETAIEAMPQLVAQVKGEGDPAINIPELVWRADVLANPARHHEWDAGPQVIEEPVAEEFVDDEFAVEELVIEEPVAEEPVAEEPVAEEPVAEEPVAEEPVAEEPVAEEPVAEEPVAEEPVAEEPVAEEPVAEEPVAEEPVAEEPVAEEPVAEEPVVEEPVVEEPVVEEPVVEEPLEHEAAIAAFEESGPEEEVAEGLMDPFLYEIFSKETSDHLANIDQFVSEAKKNDDNRYASQSLIRALHTLAGSARMANVAEIAELGSLMERIAQGYVARQLPLPNPVLEGFAASVNSVRDVVRRIGENETQLSLSETLVSDLTNYLADIDSKPLESPEASAPEEFFEEEAEMDLEDSYQPLVFNDALDSDLVSLFLEEATDILAFLDDTVQRWETQPEENQVIAEYHRSLHTLKGGARLAGFVGIGSMSHALEAIGNSVQAGNIHADDVFFDTLHFALDRLADMVEQARQGVSLAPSEEVLARLSALHGDEKLREELVQTSDDFGEADAELVEVFLEEATEILEGSEQTIQQWIEEPDNTDHITVLQRALHTLKGGARMAGFITIGNLSHALETLLIEVLESRIPTSDNLFELLEAIQYRLSDMRAEASSGKKPAEAKDLIQAVETVRRGKVADLSVIGAPSAAAPVAAKKVEAVVAVPVAKAAPVKKVIAEEKSEATVQHEMVRVRADLLDNLVNYAGEISIYRARVEQQIGMFGSNLIEMEQTVDRLREQLRKLEIETEAQILSRYEKEVEAGHIEDFDPLEFDRFSQLQQLSRALSESVNDLHSIGTSLEFTTRESETLLLQQSRVNTELQEGLMRTRMVPFANLVPRLRRIVRQTAQELKKKAQLRVVGAQGEMDRTVLDRVVAPLEHMLRNAIAHGIEEPAARAKAGKDETGTITIELSREASDVVIRVSDDGAGIDREAVRSKAQKQGLLTDEMNLTDNEVIQFILETGFSTAQEITQISGRGVGMDVVNNEIKQLGGNLGIQSEVNQGTEFTIRLPFTLAMNHALLVTVGEEVFAIPLSSIDGVVRMAHDELNRAFKSDEKSFYDYAGQRYQVMALGSLLGTGYATMPDDNKRAPVVLVQAGDHRLALQVDGLMGSREIVVKSVGAQISSVPGILGATILGDGRVVLILDMGAFVRISAGGQPGVEIASVDGDVIAGREQTIERYSIMVVDDSITMRKVSTRLLERNGMQVFTAKDGVDAVAQLQESIPDAMLLDIEMPRMDGFELATHMKNDPRLKDIPIIMITSRTGDKHRQRAMSIGVNRYMGKPYQESELLANLYELLGVEHAD